ncbi:MAG: HlyD family secretion protein [Polyangiales bacterium]|jgi:HlyD family secretion protein
MALRPRHALWLLPVLAAVGVGVWVTRTRNGPRVDTFHAVRRPLIQTLVTSGRVVHRRQSDLGSTLQSTVAEVLVDEGDTVEADALLIRLADEEAHAALAEAEASLSEADARLTGAQGVGRRLASQSLAQARIDATQAATEYTRGQGLYESGAISEAELLRARRDRDATRSRRVSASLEVAASAPSGSDAQVLRAGLARAQARLRAAEARLSQTEIRAPSAGRVLARHVERGEVVRPGEVLITFAGDGPLEIVVRPDESNLARLSVGQLALVSPEAFPERRIRARVARIAPSVDPTRGTIEIDLTIEEEADAVDAADAATNDTGDDTSSDDSSSDDGAADDGASGEITLEGTVPPAPGPAERTLRPDMTVAVEVEVGRSTDALVLPTALIRDLGTSAPWVLVAEDGQAVRRDIRLGLEGDELVEVAEGLDADDAIIAPESAAGPDDPVRPRDARPAVD